ncbi:hypothetical protein [Bradyrhizobium sp. SRS-191]|uniref:hypothetical protein n=1 Tax=Bradyrhizobium sp. SRS-191 TaxID=2962606 RepID=UPI00211E2256|nr:hypothetical protein [Bradyrhizobium sp. SRS-191]
MSSDSAINLTDEVDLLYVRGIGGWSDLHLITPRGQISIQITHVSGDPVIELSNLCRSLLRGEASGFARLRDEPGSMVVTGSVHREQRHLARVECWECSGWDGVPPHGSLILSVDVRVRQFVGLMYRQFEKVRWLYGEPSFQKRRDTFPHRSFEAFEQLWLASAT